MNDRPGKLRIIGGTLRGSRIAIADARGLRPTPDRVRQTLFDWLAPVIAGAQCLDLFAGTGALGIEALSRGAARVDFVEADAQLVDALRANLTRLKQTAQVHRADAMAFLDSAVGRYDVIFLDPPFSADLWSAATHALELRGCFAATSWVYVETPAQAVCALPENWVLHREGRAGNVRYALYRRSVKL
ncbi:MAG: 16S rRNA (guanine(966)-N(2))-methyltransferase RsmD [Rudaea sp.]